MNTVSLHGLRLEHALTEQLGRVLDSVPWMRRDRLEHVGARDYGMDILATIRSPEGRVALCVDCKSELRPSTFHQLIESKMAPPGRPARVLPVLAMPSVSERLAELCRQHGWGWYDLAGNCYLDVPGAFHIERAGNPPVVVRSRPSANLGTGEAGRVVRALLAPENAGVVWTQRLLQADIGGRGVVVPEPSLGLVNKVVRHLRDEAFLEAASRGGFRVRDHEKLLFQWRDAYRSDRDERLSYFTLLKGRALQERLHRLGLDSGGHLALASFSAADVQAPSVHQPKTWIYTNPEWLVRLEEKLEGKRVDSGENLVVLIPDDPGVFYCLDGGSAGEARPACTNSVQTYVDLCYSGGRGKEAADAVLEQRLKPVWETLGKP